MIIRSHFAFDCRVKVSGWDGFWQVKYTVICLERERGMGTGRGRGEKECRGGGGDRIIFRITNLE